MPRPQPHGAGGRQASTPPGGGHRARSPALAFTFDDDRDEEADDEDEDARGGGGGGGGGLEIVMDDVDARDEERDRRGRLWGRRQPTGEPISLRSAANSRSPAVAGPRAEPEVVDFGGGGEEAAEQEEESNEDVDEMRLGSPMAVQSGRDGVKGHGEENGGEQGEPVALEEDGGLEAELENALGGGEGSSSEHDSVALVMQPEVEPSESEVSEEE